MGNACVTSPVEINAVVLYILSIVYPCLLVVVEGRRQTRRTGGGMEVGCHGDRPSLFMGFRSLLRHNRNLCIRARQLATNGQQPISIHSVARNVDVCSFAFVSLFIIRLYALQVVCSKITASRFLTICIS